MIDTFQNYDGIAGISQVDDKYKIIPDYIIYQWGNDRLRILKGGEGHLIPAYFTIA
jgi:hypothetical protein